MPKHESKQCARCQTVFECKSGSIMLCQCQTVVLSTEQLEYISEQYEDCLCSRCLLEMRGEYNELQHARKIRALSKS